MVIDHLQSFQERCKLKIALWRKKSKVVFKQSDIWWCSLGMNLGEEIFGNRIGTLDDADFKKAKKSFLEFYST